MSNFSSYYNDTLSGGLITSLTDQLNNTMNQIRQINSGGTSTEYGDNKAQALEDLKKYTDELMKSLEDVEGLIKDVNKAYSDMVKSAQSAFSEQINTYDFIEKILNHNKKLSQLLYG
jgi:phage tail tape-measure protein